MKASEHANNFALTERRHRPRTPDRQSDPDQLASASARSGQLSAQSILSLQRSAGNRAVVSLLVEHNGPKPIKDPRLEAPRTIQRYTGPIPPRGLPDKEVYTLIEQSETTMFDMRGHTVKRHGAKVTEEDLRRRNIPVATAFTTSSAAKHTIAQSLEEGKGQINGWLASTQATHKEVDVDARETIGRGLRRVGPAFEPIEDITKARAVYGKRAVPEAKKPEQRAKRTDWYLVTCFPTPE